ncbi:MAG: molybdopterin oxidoreductase family protein, partial [Acidimicrobiales bacterium]
GDAVEVATFPDEPFTSYFSGNTVQICPVGALPAAPYRFKARPWDLEQVESSCTSCSIGCRVAIQSSGDRLTRSLGVDSDPVNQSWLCDKGRFDWQAISSEDRVTAPRIRKGDQLVEVGWSEALEKVAADLAKAKGVRGGAAIGIIGGARLANEDAYAWSKLARAVLGTDNVDAQLGDGLPASLVLGLPRATIDQACEASAVITVSPDLKEELPIIYLRLRAAVKDTHLPIIEIAEQTGGLSRDAAVTLLHRPGEAHLVARALLADEDPTAEVAGVPRAQMMAARGVLQEVGKNDGADAAYVVVAGRPSLGSSSDAVVEAVATLFAGLPGVRLLSALRRGNVHGALDMGLAPGVLPGRVDLADGREWFSATGAWGSLPDAAGMDTTTMLQEAAEGRLAALVLLGADPLSDFPDRTLARKGLQGAGMVVAVDCFLTESSKKADVVLPAATYAERPGTFTNLEGRVLRLGQKVTAPGVAWPDWMIAAELAWKMGADLGLDHLDGIWEEIERLSPAHAGITPALLAGLRAKDGVVVPLDTSVGGGPVDPAPLDPMAEPGIIAAEVNWPSALDVPHPGTAVPGEVERAAEGEAGHADQLAGGVATADAEIAGATAGGASAAGASAGALPEGADAGDAALKRPPMMRFQAPTKPVPVPPVDAYSLRLVSGRRLWDAGVGVQHSPHLAGLAATATIRAHPADM